MKHLSGSRIVILSVILAAIAIESSNWIALFRSEKQLRADKLAQAEKRALQLANSEANHIEMLLFAIDNELHQFRDAALAGNRHGLEIISDNAFGAFPKGAVNNMSLIDSKGQLTYSRVTPKDKAYFGDRDYFRFHREAGKDSLFLTRPLASRVTGEWVILMSRPLLKQGRFDGVANITLLPAYFASTTERLAVDSGDTISLLYDDGTFIARNIAHNEVLGKITALDRPFLSKGAAAKGTFRASGFVDGIPRVYAWFRLTNYPLLIVIGLSESTLLAPVEVQIRDSRVTNAIGTSVVLLLVIFAYFLTLKVVRRETALRKSEEANRAITQSAHDAIVTCDRSGNVVGWNPHAQEIFGYSESEVLGKPVTMLMPERYRDRHLAGIGRAMSGGEHHIIGKVVELNGLRKNGSEFPLELSLAMWETTDGRHATGIIRDVTERKEAEEALQLSERSYREIFNSVTNAVFIHDAKTGAIVDVNDAMLRIYGYSDREAVINLHPNDIGYGESPYGFQEATEWMRKAITDGPQEFEWKAINKKDGLPLWLEVSLRSATIGGQARVLAVVRDATKRRREERLLRLEHAVAALIASAEDASDTMRKILRTICESEGWEFGLHWRADDDAGILCYDEYWSVPDAWADLYARESRKAEFRKGTGIVGRVWESEKPVWVPDVAQDGRIVQKVLTESRLRSLFAFPLFAAEKVTGVIIFLSRDQREPDERLLTAAQMLGSQIGQFMKRKQAEEESLKVAERLELATQAGRIGIWDLDLTHNRLVWDDEMFRIYGVKREDYVGAFEAWEHGLHPDDKARTIAETELAKRGEKDFDAEFRVLWSDGTVRHIKATASVYRDHAGAPIRMIGTNQDITERKQAADVLKRNEARFRSYFNQPMIGIAITSPEKGWLEINPRLCEMLGYPREEIARLTWAEITHPDDIAGDVAQFERVLRGEIEGYSMDKRFLRKDGGTIHVAMSVSCVRTEDGRIDYFVALIQDITERVLLETRTRESQKMEALGALAGGVAHDFNNALATILGNAELARQDVGKAHPALESLEEIAKAGRRAKNLVLQILAFGRRQVTQRKTTALCPIVQEAAQLLRKTLPAGVNLEVHCAQDTPDVLADVTQIEQVLLNLCTNAWHALNGVNREGLIEIRLEAEISDGEYFACLTVRDNGRGMDEVTRARIFEPFFTTKAVGEGTGLGLSVVHGILKDHGASVEVRSELGEGSSFIIHFPAAQPETSTSIEPNSPAVAVGKAEALVLHGDGKRILYIDDDESIVFLMTRLLERQGYRVTGLTDARAALAEVRTNPRVFDLVVTDYNMPGISGLDVARTLKDIRADLPVVLASGYITDELRDKAPEAGVLELVYKPDTTEELCRVVTRLAHTVAATPRSA